MVKRRNMLGLIGFDHYQIFCIIGDLPQERKQEQELYVDLRVETDFSDVAESDLLKDTVDYVPLAKICRDIATQGKYQTIEKYAAQVLEEVMAKFAVKSAWIRVKKPKALPGADYAVVELRM